MTERIRARFDESMPTDKKAYGAHILFDGEPNCIISLIAGQPELRATFLETTAVAPEELLHMPVLDDDAGLFRVLPSRTAGHSHVYIDKPLRWDQCVKLLSILLELELVDVGWANLCLTQHTMTVRMPAEDGSVESKP